MASCSSVQPYMAVFPPLLSPVFWERHGNVPALSRLLVAYLSKAGQEIAAGGERPCFQGPLGQFVIRQSIAHRAP